MPRCNWPNKSESLKHKIPLKEANPAFVAHVRQLALGPLNDAYTKIADKQKREDAVNAVS